MAVKRLFLLAMLVACSVQAADFGDIPASLALPAGTSVRRNAGNTGFESFTPGGGGGTPGGSNTQVQFNDSNTFGGDSRFTFDKATGILVLPPSVTMVAPGVDLSVPNDSDLFIKFVGGSLDGGLTLDGGNGGTIDITTSGGDPDGAALTINTGQSNGANGNGGDIVIVPGTGFGAGRNGIVDINGNLLSEGSVRFSALTTNGIVITTGSNGTLAVATPTSTPTPTATATPTATPTATATATATPTPSATATAFPQGFTAHFSRGGAALQVNDVTLTPWTTKYPGTITGFIISADQGTCTLKVWKKATGTAIPTIADVINTSGVSLATGTHIDSSTVSDFTTTTVSIGDQFMAQITAVSGGATDITFQVPIRQ